MKSVPASQLVVGRVYRFVADAGAMGLSENSGIFRGIADENYVTFYSDLFRANFLVSSSVNTFFNV